MFVRSPRERPSTTSSSAVCLSTGNDSPVNADSSTRRLNASASRPSADGRLAEAFNLRVEESALTGESLPVDKQTAELDVVEGLSLGDRTNMVYSGTAIAYGRGAAVVVA